MGTSAPKFSLTGSQSALPMKARPYFLSVIELPMTSDTRIAASRLNTSTAKKRVSWRNAASIQGWARRRSDVPEECADGNASDWFAKRVAVNKGAPGESIQRAATRV